MKTTLAIAAAIVSAAGLAFAHTGRHQHAVKPKPARHAIVCPVTGTHIASVSNAVGHSTFKGKTYYFCCGDCKPRFDKAPAKFVKNAAKGKFEKM